MKNTIKTLAFTVLVLTSIAVKAQQQPNFLFFEQNMSLFNPAYTGSEGSLAGLQYRSAWSGIEDAPRAASFIYHTKEKNKASWGISYLTDRVYIENQGIVAIDYSYKLALGGNTNLYLGIKAGVVYNNLDATGLDRITQESNANLNSIQNYMNPLVGIGLLLKSEKFFIGLSTPNMLNSKRYKEAEGLATTATDKPHLYTTAGFHLKLNNVITLSPSMLYRMVADAPNQLTSIAKLSLKDKISLGVGVSNNDYISSMIQVKLSQIDIGFGYEIGQRTSSTALRANTSEMMLRYRF
ncbi:MAG: PorP/SprF family type IX secretion system membrane protein [Flavobacteriaceae bacterium]|nr:PorP/SprF family type IX secretion system membrane protein [Flavobacteriaceae bacterium]